MISIAMGVLDWKTNDTVCCKLRVDILWGNCMIWIGCGRKQHSISDASKIAFLSMLPLLDFSISSWLIFAWQGSLLQQVYDAGFSSVDRVCIYFSNALKQGRKWQNIFWKHKSNLISNTCSTVRPKFSKVLSKIRSYSTLSIVLMVNG